MSVTPTPWQADPATRDLLAKIEAAQVPPMHTQTPVQARSGILASRDNDIDPPPVSRVENRTIPGPGGDLPVRCYYPKQAKGKQAKGKQAKGKQAKGKQATGKQASGKDGNGLPTLLYFHGGGFVIGDLDSHDILARQFCELADVLVISVDYRLAPESHYPAAVEDALCAVDWIKANAMEVGADLARLAVAGDSAGGTLAAIAAQHARDTGLALKAQLLLYPVVDLSREYPSHKEHEHTYPLFKPVLDWFWSHYLGPNDNAATREEVWASPIRARDFSELAPAFVLTAGLDPLRDEGAAYAARLAEAGVETVYQCTMGTLHGYLRLGRLLPVARDTLVAAAHFLMQRL